MFSNTAVVLPQLLLPWDMESQQGCLSGDD